MIELPAPEIRLAILFSVCFAIALFIGIVVIMYTVGNITNHLTRIQDLITKELVLRYNQQVNFFKQEKQRKIAQAERERRQAALLNIPLVRTSSAQRSAAAAMGIASPDLGGKR
jgi:predicted PurR-regulated permease PerM